VEGIVLASAFDELIARGAARGIRFAPLGALLPEDPSTLPADTITTAAVAGREGWVGWQTDALARAH
jgi:undecaprenyl phosphate-alpha-L-ara4FN deformylase